MLSHYVRVGVEELDREKLPPCCCLNITTLLPIPLPIWADSGEIGNVFAGFQKYLYRDTA